MVWFFRKNSFCTILHRTYKIKEKSLAPIVIESMFSEFNLTYLPTYVCTYL